MPDILEQLYTDYYVANKSPDQLYSSYWKFWHGKSSVKANNGKFTEVKGVGFGEQQAKSWANQFLSWACNQAYLQQLPNRQELIQLIKIGAPLAKRMGLKFTNDCFRQICSFAVMRKELKTSSPQVVIIGDGYGFLSAFIKEMLPDAKICLIDLGKTLFFQAYGLQKAFPQAKHCLVGESLLSAAVFKEADFVYCPAQHLKSIDQIKADVAFNICSMQEMNKATVDGYFHFLRTHLNKDNLFYCCNRLELIMKGGEVSRFYEYPWDAKDVHYLEGPCPWNRFFMAVKPAKNGPKIFNAIRIPFISYYDGPSNHRLSKLQLI